MEWRTRIRFAAKAALLHLGLSLLAAAGVAWLVFGIWYPSPFHEVTGGRTLFLILMAVDVVCGPVLTFVLYNPSKSRAKWRLDVCLIVFTQLGALAYGLEQVASARPLFVALEGDRFRIVQAFDVDVLRLQEAPVGLRSIGYGGPRLLGVRLAHSGDPDYLGSLQLSIQGVHPAFRPSRWRAFEEQIPGMLKELRSIGVLRAKHPEKVDEIDEKLKQIGVSDESVGYLPMVRAEITDWVVLVRRSDGQPFAYLHLDGW